MFLVKFGQEKHLSMLQSGQIYFGSIVKYRTDESKGRGDPNEAVIPLTTKGWKIIDDSGKHISLPIGKARYSFQEDQNIFAFCASIIDETNSVVSENGNTVFKKAFLDEMKQFGEFALVFHSDYILMGLSKYAQSKNSIGYKTGKIRYVREDQIDSLPQTDPNGWLMSRFFFKKNDYVLQNEWRAILYDTSNIHSTIYQEGFPVKSEPFIESLLIPFAQLYANCV